MEGPILLATDLDRTLLPNGRHPESPMARTYFRQFVTRPEVNLVYVTGRHQELTRVAMAEYALPTPRFVIANVGTCIYEIQGTDWRFCEAWHKMLMSRWSEGETGQLMAALNDLRALRLQEASKQSPLKLSYYADNVRNPSALLAQVRERLAAIGANMHMVWSVDETSDTGLLDILPAGASKLHALEYLRNYLGIALEKTVFAGDSGNDMEVLVSDIPSVLVANAEDTVREEAIRQSARDTLYVAQGGLAGMNGYYSAGILEGVIHFLPATRAWLDALENTHEQFS